MRRIASSLLLAFVALFLVAGTTPAVERPRIGLVLGGGGARGIAHVGILRALEDLRVPVDVIAGTSMGGLVGGLYAAGATPDQIDSILTTADWEAMLATEPPRDGLPYHRKPDLKTPLAKFELGLGRRGVALPRGIVVGQRMSETLEAILLPVARVGDFDRLPIPFRAISVDVASGEMVVLDRGDLARALRATMAVPGAFTPVEIEGRLLMDGGIVRNIPVETAREMGADVVIAVSVATAPDEHANIRTAIDVLVQSVAIVTDQSGARSTAKLGPRDLLIDPDLGGVDAGTFTEARRLIALGERAASEAVGDLRRYSVSEEEYRAYLDRRRAANLLVPVAIPVDTVIVDGSGFVPRSAVRRRFGISPGDTLTAERLRAGIADVYALGDFESVATSLREADGRMTLTVRADAKKWGPGYLRGGIRLADDLVGDSRFDILASYIRTWIDPWGATATIDAQIGRTGLLAAEFRQPIPPGGPLFLAPGAEFRRTLADHYRGDRRTGQYRLISGSAVLAGGVELDERGEVRVGWRRGRAKADTRIGLVTGLPGDAFDTGALEIGLVNDRIDRVTFPSKGTLASARLVLSDEVFGADSAYRTLAFAFRHARTADRITILASADAGFPITGGVPFFEEHVAGGLLDLSGHRFGQLRGDVLGIARLIAWRRTGSLYLPVYAGGSIEAGNVWRARSNVSIRRVRVAFGGFVGADTPFGPVMVGFGAGRRITADVRERWNGSVYLTVGQAM